MVRPAIRPSQACGQHKKCRQPENVWSIFHDGSMMMDTIKPRRILRGLVGVSPAAVSRARPGATNGGCRLQLASLEGNDDGPANPLDSRDNHRRIHERSNKYRRDVEVGNCRNHAAATRICRYGHLGGFADLQRTQRARRGWKGGRCVPIPKTAEFERDAGGIEAGRVLPGLSATTASGV